MTSPPPEPDRALSRERASALIRTSFPAIDSEAPTHLGSGWDFDAFRTNDGWVFRFPRQAGGADLLEREGHVRNAFAPASAG